jgi:hypothetical protein
MALRTCLSSLCQQTIDQWEAIVVDNSDPGPAVDEHARLCEMDPRIRHWYVREQTAMTMNDSRHSHSLYKATEMGVLRTTGEWLVLPNDDSYYTPWFLERMLRAYEENHWDLIYCDLVMGGPREHHYMRVEPKLCQIDKTCFLLKRGWFTGFSREPVDYPKADGLMIEDLVRKGIRHGRVPEILVCHN